MFSFGHGNKARADDVIMRASFRFRIQERLPADSIKIAHDIWSRTPGGAICNPQTPEGLRMLIRLGKEQRKEDLAHLPPLQRKTAFDFPLFSLRCPQMDVMLF